MCVPLKISALKLQFSLECTNDVIEKPLKYYFVRYVAALYQGSTQDCAKENSIVKMMNNPVAQQ